MRPIAAILFAASIVGLSAGSAMADCVDTTSSIGGQKQAGISKDGTHAPLESSTTGGAAANTTNTNGGTGTNSGTAMNAPANKTGDTMPLASKQGGGDKNLATSQQDVNAQQHGDKTAAAKADKDACKD